MVSRSAFAENIAISLQQCAEAEHVKLVIVPNIHYGLLLPEQERHAITQVKFASWESRNAVVQYLNFLAGSLGYAGVVSPELRDELAKHNMFPGPRSATSSDWDTSLVWALDFPSAANQQRKGMAALEEEAEGECAPEAGPGDEIMPGPVATPEAATEVQSDAVPEGELEPEPAQGATTEDPETAAAAINLAVAASTAAKEAALPPGAPRGKKHNEQRAKFSEVFKWLKSRGAVILETHQGGGLARVSVSKEGALDSVLFPSSAGLKTTVDFLNHVLGGKAYDGNSRSLRGNVMEGLRSYGFMPNKSSAPGGKNRTWTAWREGLAWEYCEKRGRSSAAGKQ